MSKYKIAVVVDCLTKPKLYILSIAKINDEIIAYQHTNEQIIKVKITEQTGAIGSLYR